MITFYHSADFDGKCSGAIVKHFFPLTKLIGIDYGQPFPWNEIQEGEEVVMVDFSLPLPYMIKLESLSSNFLWIDHHKSAIEAAKKYNWFNGESKSGYNVLDINHAACELTWKYFSKELLPLSVYWLGRYDIWKHQENPGSLEFQYGMGLYEGNPEDTEFWSKLFIDKSFVHKIKEQGKIALAYEKKKSEQYLKTLSFETEFEEYKCLALNRGMCNSLTFDSLWDNTKYDIMLAFSYRKNLWSISLYTDKPDIDVSEICKRHGGGGHRQAAGFVCNKLPFKMKGEVSVT